VCSCKGLDSPFILLENVTGRGRTMSLETEKPAKRKSPPRLSKAQIRETLKETPIEQILGTAQPLTHKQREYARKLAEGAVSKRQAYRETYNTSNASTLAHEPYRLAQNPRVSREVEAYRLAIEAEKLRTPRELKALLIHQLVKHSIDEDFPPAQRMKALELIGKLYDVGAFMERKETTVIHQKSGDIKAQLLERIKQVIDVDAKPKRTGGASLLAEISDGADPTPPPPPAPESEDGGDPSHNIPHVQSLEKSSDDPSAQSTDTPPVTF
jgi:hypothetical protein